MIDLEALTWALSALGIDILPPIELAGARAVITFPRVGPAEKFATLASWRDPAFASWTWVAWPIHVDEPEHVAVMIVVSVPTEQIATIVDRLTHAAVGA